MCERFIKHVDRSPRLNLVLVQESFELDIPTETFHASGIGLEFVSALDSVMIVPDRGVMKAYTICTMVLLSVLASTKVIDSRLFNTAQANVTDIETQTVDTLGPVSVGSALPTFGGHTLGGQYMSFKNLLNKDQTIVVSYFATWCGPCRQGLPVIESVVSQSDAVTGVYIAFGEKNPRKVHHFAQELSLSQPIILDKFELEISWQLNSEISVAGVELRFTATVSLALNPDMVPDP